MSIESITDLANQLDKMTLKMNQRKLEKQDEAVQENLREMMNNDTEMQEMPGNIT